MANRTSINRIDNIISKQQFNNTKQTIVLNDELNVNDSVAHFPTFAETLSTFKQMLLDAEKELSNSSLKQPDTIRSFEAKIGLSKFNSNTSISNKLNRRKSSVTERKSKSRLINQQTQNKQNKSADSDDEKSKKKVLNSSIKEKCNKLNEKLNLENANEHFTNLLRLRNENKLIELVKMHLLLLIDLDGENFSNVFEDEQVNKKTNTIKKKKQDNKNDIGIFQQVLTEEGICRLYLLTEFIRIPKNINQEGIFRKCGSTARQQELKYRLQKNISLELETGKYTVHDCTNVLKTCLSEMPEPLLTNLFFKIISQKLITNENNSKCFTELDFEKIFGDKNLKIIQLILLLIPLNRRKFANHLLNLLNEIASKKNSTNKMDAKSLATLFAPHLLCPKTMSPTDLQRYITILTIQLEFMIKNVKQIFKTPNELTLDIRKELERLDNPNKDEDDDGINTVVTFCDRKAIKTNQTEQHIAELYAHIQGMPETPAKKKLIKQFNRQNGGLTPQLDKENSKKKQNKFKINLIGEKIKNARNLFKPNNSNSNKASKREDSNQQLNDCNGLIDKDLELNHNKHLKTNINESKGNHLFVKSNSTDQYLPSPNKKLSQKPETPLSDLTATKFCIDDEEDTNDLLMYHKKLREYNSDDESLQDSPWASESFKV